MSGEPDRVFESCTGTLDDKPAPAEFIAMANVLTSTWKKPGPGEWGNKSHIGHLRYHTYDWNLLKILELVCRWDVGYRRGPDCGAKGTFGREFDEEDYWGRSNLIDECCFSDDKMDCFNDEECREKCTYLNAHKQRFIGADVGYVLDWEIVDGLPRGCSAFKNSDGTDKTERQFGESGTRGMAQNNEGVGCPKQMMSDGEGGVMHETVKYFADNLKQWHEAFLKAFIKMQGNGYEVDDLKTNDLSKFWKHI